MDQNYTLPILDNSLLINFHANTLKVTQNTIMNEEMKYRQMLQSSQIELFTRLNKKGLTKSHNFSGFVYCCYVTAKYKKLTI